MFYRFDKYRELQLKSQMFRYLTKISRFQFSKKPSMKEAFYNFLNLEVGTVVRNTPEFRQRKYKNVEIKQEFQKQQRKRKEQKLYYLQRRKQLLQQSTKFQQKLIDQGMTKQQAMNQLVKIKDKIQEQKKQLMEIQQKIDQLEPNMMVVQGVNKLGIINKIQYYRYVDRHPSGTFFTPNQLQNIENVHYLVTHNLPIHRYKIYEIAPELFEAQLGEIDEATRQMIQDKYSGDYNEALAQQKNVSIRKFIKSRKIQTIDEQLRQDKQQVFDGMMDFVQQISIKNAKLIQEVNNGKTVYRNLKHLFLTVLSIKLKFPLTPQQQNLKKDLLELLEVKKKWVAYCEEFERVFNQIKFGYIDPPPYVKNHPMLMSRWEQIMQIFTNPVSIQDTNLLEHRIDKRGEYLQTKIRKMVEKKFDPQFQASMVDLLNRKVDNKKLQIDFLKEATQILQDLQQLQAQARQKFVQLPKPGRESLRKKQENYIRITPDELTKMIYLNNQNKEKYNVEFFSKYFGIPIEILKRALTTFSYLRLNVSKQLLSKKQKGEQITQEAAIKQVKPEIIKFIL